MPSGFMQRLQGVLPLDGSDGINLKLGSLQGIDDSNVGTNPGSYIEQRRQRFGWTDKKHVFPQNRNLLEAG